MSTKTNCLSIETLKIIFANLKTIEIFYLNVGTDIRKFVQALQKVARNHQYVIFDSNEYKFLKDVEYIFNNFIFAYKKEKIYI